MQGRAGAANSAKQLQVFVAHREPEQCGQYQSRPVGTPSQAAALMQAQAILKDVGLPNSYTLTKHMAEGLVADMHAAGALPSAIVRPSIVSCIARAPAPGYFGNSAGLTSLVLVYASGERRGSGHR